jgi:CheY-like chemotaxis protein
MGGDIELLSSEIHVGSSFLIILPVKEAIYSLSAPDTLGKKREYNLSGLKILLVEDAPDNQLLMTHILKNSGCYLEVVSNGELAIERVATKDFDLILMDIGMPVMDGITATRILRKRDYKGSIIALSAHAMKSEVEECLRSGFDAHISKPVDFDRLMNTIVETSKKHIPYSASSQRNDLTEEKQLH